MEQAKANQAAVLRQQVFHFDPNYDPFAGAGGAGAAGPGLQLFGSQTGVGGLGGGSVADSGSVAGGASVAGSTPFPPGGGSFVHNPNAPRGPSFNGRNQNGENSSAHFGGIANGGSGNNNASNHTQEELLKQLFPSWF